MLFANNDIRTIINTGKIKLNSTFLFLIKYRIEMTKHAINTDSIPVRLLVRTSENIGNIDKKYHLLLFLAR